jgi:uncharacterized protein (TIGR03435 family)
MSAPAFAQGPATPTFEVASIRPSEGGKGESIAGTQGGGLSARNARLSACIAWAYGVQDYQISGPSWLNELRFDIVAKAGSSATEADTRRMLQTLLADRFKLEFHRQSREMPALVMTVAKGGHKLKAVQTDDPPSFQTGKLQLTGKGATLAQLAEFLSGQLRTPVIDQTGLTGRFDYFLDINAFVTEEIQKNLPRDGGPPMEAGGIIAKAVQEQLGLKVESRKAPVEMLVIDHVEKTPTEN